MLEWGCVGCNSGGVCQRSAWDGEEPPRCRRYGAAAGELSLSPRRSLYARIYSSEPLALVDCFVERIDGVGKARATCDDLQLEVVEAEPCTSRPFTYEPYQGD